MPLDQADVEVLKKVNKQAMSLCSQFENGALSLSEFLFAAMALEAANRDVVTRMHELPWNEHPVAL